MPLPRRRRHRQARLPGWGRRRARSCLLAALLAPALLLQGCSGPGLVPRQSLHVLVVSNDENAWLQRDYRETQTWEPLLRAFRRLYPGVAVELSVQPESVLRERLSHSSSRGLSPDLLLLRAPAANALLDRGLVDPLPQGDPTVRRALGLITPQLLRRVTTARGISGLPLFNEFTLACYDRRRLPRAPATVAELLALAASGRPVGLTLEPAGLWWTVGAQGVEDTVMSIINGPAAGGAAGADERASLVSWLRWLRQAALQSRVQIASSSRELTLELESGHLAWIPCFSLTLHRLDRTLGRHLGVAPLPSGMGGRPSPYIGTSVWALGRDSSAAQRRLALDLAVLSLDPLVQRDITLAGRTMLPANRLVPIPVSSSSRLAVLAQAQSQLDEASPLLSVPYSLDRLQVVIPGIESVLMQVLVGAMTPEQGAGALLRLRSSR